MPGAQQILLWKHVAVLEVVVEAGPQILGKGPPSVTSTHNLGTYP